MSLGVALLQKWLNKTLKIKMSDGRVLVGVFLCTDRDANVILGSCSEYLPDELQATQTDGGGEEPRMLGLVMVPGKHLVSVCIDQSDLDNAKCESVRQPPHLIQISEEEIL